MGSDGGRKKDRSDAVFVDWKMKEIYDLIHQLQPQCLVGNNHHLNPLPGEDFQMFERDLPGQNAHGLSFQKISTLPLETCATLNDSWGYSLKDNHTKSFKEFVHLLVNAAGSNANLLMNVGPQPDGKIPADFVQRFDQMGDWLKIYGESIYNTRGGYLMPQNWGALTQNQNKVYIHILNNEPKVILLENVPYKKIKSASLLNKNTPIQVELKNKNLKLINPRLVDENNPDTVIVLNID